MAIDMSVKYQPDKKTFYVDWSDYFRYVRVNSRIKKKKSVSVKWRKL